MNTCPSELGIPTHPAEVQVSIFCLEKELIHIFHTCMFAQVSMGTSAGSVYSMAWSSIKIPQLHVDVITYPHAKINTVVARFCYENIVNMLWWKWLTWWQRTFTAITANHRAGTGTVDSQDDAMSRPQNTHNYEQYYLSARKTMCRASSITKITYP